MVQKGVGQVQSMPVLGGPSPFSGLIGDAGSETVNGSLSGAQFAALLSAMKRIVDTPESSIPIHRGLSDSTPDKVDPSTLRAWIDAANSYLQSIEDTSGDTPTDTS